MSALINKLNKLPFFVYCVTGSAVLVMLSFNHQHIDQSFLSAIIVLSAAYTFLSLLFVKRFAALFAMSSAILVSALIFGCTYYQALLPAMDITSRSTTIEMHVSSIASNNDDFLAVVGTAKVKGNDYKTILYIDNSRNNIKVGDTIKARSKIYYAGSNYNLGKGIYIKGYADKVIATDNKLSAFDKLKLNIDKYCGIYKDNNIRSLVQALLTGDKSDMDEQVRNDFSLSGTAHIIAVSGLHLTILLSFCIKIFGRKVGSIIGIPVIFIYTIISGFSPSALRAFIMALMATLAFLFKRDYNVYSSYVFAMYIILLINPFSIYNISFLLSFASVLGIIVVYPPISKKISAIVKGKGFIGRPIKFILSSIGISFCATVFSNLVSAATFDRISFISMLSNIFMVIPSSVLLVLSILNYFICLISPAAASLIGINIISHIAKLILSLNSMFSGIPFASVRTAADHLLELLIFIAVMAIFYSLVRDFFPMFAIMICAAFVVFNIDNYLVEQSRCYIDIKNVSSQPMMYIRSPNNSFIIGGGNGKNNYSLKFIDRKLLEYNCSLDALFISKMNKANITGAMLVKNKYPDTLIYGSHYNRKKKYDLQYIRYNNNTLKRDELMIGFETLPYNEGVITLTVSGTNILWLPSISKNRMFEYFDINAVRDANIVVMNELFYSREVRDKILKFPSLDTIIICTEEDNPRLKEEISGVKIMQASREELNLVFTLQ